MVNNLTMRQRIARDFKVMSKRSGRLGAGYWQEFCQTFGSSVDPSQCLTVNDKGESIAEPLLAALDHAHSKNAGHKTTEPLIAYLGHAGPMNQRAYVGMLRVFC